MTTWNKEAWTISHYFACAVEYGDYGDMSADEIIQFDNWVNASQAGRTGYWSMDDEGGTNYQTCEITGFFSDCMEISYNFKE